MGSKVDDGQAPLNPELRTPGVGEGPGSEGCVELSEIQLAKWHSRLASGYQLAAYPAVH